MKVIPVTAAVLTALLATAASANATVVLGTVTPGALNGSSATVSFDSVPVGTTGTFTTGGVTFSGVGGVVVGNKSGIYEAPAGDTSNYLSTTVKGGAGSETLSLSTVENVFGLYWGSIDKYNTLTFLLDGVTVGEFKGSSVVSSFNAVGNSGVSAYVTFSGAYNEVVFSTTQAAFEVDNIAVSAVPEPATWALMLAGFAGLGFAAYRQTKRSENLVLA